MIKIFLQLICGICISSSVVASANDGHSCRDLFSARAEPLELKKSSTGTKNVPALFPEGARLGVVKLQEDVAMREISKSSDPRFNDAMTRLFNMLSETMYVAADRKSTIEKGELILGQALTDGYSLQFEYKGDLRGQTPRFLLGKISLVSPNGRELPLSKMPLLDQSPHLQVDQFSFVKPGGKENSSATSTTGGGLVGVDLKAFAPSADVIDVKKVKDVVEKLKKSSVLESEFVAFESPESIFGHADDANAFQALLKLKTYLREADQNVIDAHVKNVESVQVPTVIEGLMLVQLQKWSGLLAEMDRAQIRTVGEKGYTFKTLVNAQAKQFGSFLWTIGKKQSGKYLLLGAILYAYTSGLIDKDELYSKFVESFASQLDRAMMVEISKQELNGQGLKILAQLFTDEPEVSQQLRRMAEDSAFGPDVLPTELGVANLLRKIRAGWVRERSLGENGKADVYVGKLAVSDDKNAATTVGAWSRLKQLDDLSDRLKDGKETAPTVVAVEFRASHEILLGTVQFSNETLHVSSVVLNRDAYPQVYKRVQALLASRRLLALQAIP